MQASCLCCEKHIPVERPRIFPVCNHEFKGKGWDGTDAHWRSKKKGHENIMAYEKFWETLCFEHKS